MKLRHPWIVKSLGRAGASVLRLSMSTVRARTESCGQRTDPWDLSMTERFIYAFWHESMLFTMTMRSHSPATALTSHHADGELISQVCHFCGVRTVRGSSTRGGGEALDELLALAHQTHLLIAPDGPQGPRRQVKRGLIQLASWTGMRIVPLGIGFQRAWRLKSWDRMALPKPWSTITCIAGPVMSVPRGIGKSAAEDYRQTLERTMLAATEAAEAWATGKTWQVPWPVPLAAAA